MKSKSDTLDFFRDPNVSRETANKNFMRNFECGKNDFMATKTYGLDMECYGAPLNSLVCMVNDWFHVLRSQILIFWEIVTCTSKFWLIHYISHDPIKEIPMAIIH